MHCYRQQLGRRTSRCCPRPNRRHQRWFELHSGDITWSCEDDNERYITRDIIIESKWILVRVVVVAFVVFVRQWLTNNTKHIFFFSIQQITTIWFLRMVRWTRIMVNFHLRYLLVRISDIESSKHEGNFYTNNPIIVNRFFFLSLLLSWKCQYEREEIYDTRISEDRSSDSSFQQRFPSY